MHQTLLQMAFAERNRQMNSLAYFLTQKITKDILDQAAKDGTAKDGSHQVRQVSIYGWISWAGVLLGLILGGAIIFFDQLAIGICVLLLFGALSIPVLCVKYNCLLTYDEKGFTWRNVLRINHRYSYEDVTGLYSSPLRVVVELNGHKQLDFDQSWLNREDFAHKIRKCRSQKPPKLPMPVLGMSLSEIETSYEGGVFARALLVKECEREQFGRFKWIHYGICTLSCLFAGFALLCSQVFQEESKAVGLSFLVLPGVLCMAAALYLYFRYPQYFTAREMPAEGALPKQKKVRHKRCTLAVTSLMSICGGAFFFICQISGKTQVWPLFVAAGAAGLLFWALLVLFRRFSWEYQNFRVGYVSFAFWQVLFCITIFFALGGLFFV